jgi:hypothetical protein
MAGLDDVTTGSDDCHGFGALHGNWEWKQEWDLGWEELEVIVVISGLS